MHNEDHASIFFHSGNKNKISEASQALNRFHAKVRPFDELQQDVVVIEPQMDEFEAIVKSKLNQVLSQTNPDLKDNWVMVEDSGLVIDELGGFPGPYSSYVYASIGVEGIIRLMTGASTRSARYISSLAVWNGNEVHQFTETCEGKISMEPAGEHGFGYDPIFIPRDGIGQTFSQMKSNQKNEISHRSKALYSMANTLLLPSI